MKKEKIDPDYLIIGAIAYPFLLITIVTLSILITINPLVDFFDILEKIILFPIYKISSPLANIFSPFYETCKEYKIVYLTFTIALSSILGLIIGLIVAKVKVRKRK